MINRFFLVLLAMLLVLLVFTACDDDDDDDDTVTINYASDEDSFAEALTEGAVTLSADITIDDYTSFGYVSQGYYSLTDPDDGITEYEIDLNGNTLSIAADGNTLTIEEGSTLTIKNGTFSIYTYIENVEGLNITTLSVQSGRLVLENMTYVGGPTILCVGDEGSLTVTGSTITAIDGYGIRTGDGKRYYGNANITVTNSTITATGTADSTAILYNMDGNLTITDSTITGGRQAVLAKMGTIEISGSTLTSEAKYVPSSEQYVDSTWKCGNEVPYCTLVVGNRLTGTYTGGNTTCEVKDTVITMASGTNNTGIVYVAADNGYTTSFTYSDIAGSFGDTSYSSGDDIVGTNYYVADGSTLTINGTSY